MSLWILVILAAIFLIRAAAPLLVPIVIAVLLSYALGPIEGWLRGRGLPRWVSSGATALILVSAVALAAALLIVQGRAAIDQMPAAADRLRSLIADSRLLQPLVEQSTESIRNAALRWLSASVGSTLQLAGDLVVVIFLVFFLLLEGNHFRERLVEVTERKSGLTRAVLDDIDAQIRRFVIVRVITAAIVGAATAAALAWMGVEQAALWGLLAGVFNSIPYFGPVIVSGGLLLLGLAQTGDVGRALQMSGVALIITSLEGWLITPPLLGKVEAMNPTVIFVGLLTWTWLWGPWGALLGVPMVVIIKAVADHVERLRHVSRLMSR